MSVDKDFNSSINIKKNNVDEDVKKNLEKIDISIIKLNEIKQKVNEEITECDKYINIYNQSKSLLDSKNFNSDIGREEEINQIRMILKRCSKNFISECIFLSGPSGQGKTYSIFYIINEIENEKKKKKKDTYNNIDNVHYYVSCSNCNKPYDIFVDILQQVMNKDNKNILNDIKNKYNINGLEEVKKCFINYTSKLNNLKIVIVDELDFIAVKNVRIELKTKNKINNEDAIKNLFECVQNNKCKIILIGIANSFDLIKDYKHIKINQIIYKPYTEKQFMDIIKNKLNTIEEEIIEKIFKGVSLKLHLRQISNRNGDIRSCFDVILRVFSEKIINLEERKQHLFKLKEEIQMNEDFNEEKKNLYIDSCKLNDEKELNKNNLNINNKKKKRKEIKMEKENVKKKKMNTNDENNIDEVTTNDTNSKYDEVENKNENDMFLLNYDKNNFNEHYVSAFKELYQNINKLQDIYNQNKKKETDIFDINMQNLTCIDNVIDEQIKILEKKYQNIISKNNTNEILLSDIKKITDKNSFDENKDVLFKIKSLPLIHKIYLYACCNVANKQHFLSEEEEEQEKEEKERQSIEITHFDIQNSYRLLCSQLSEASNIKDILHGSTLDQAIEHFEELGILTNRKKGKEKPLKMSKVLNSKFHTKNTKQLNKNKTNIVYNFNLPIKVIKQTLKDISAIMSTFDNT